jgi:hypothetical protein
MGSVLPLAKTGSEILETTIRRVIESHDRSGTQSIDALKSPQATSELEGGLSVPKEPTKSVSQSPDSEPWSFEINPSEMDWAAQNPEFFESFDFANLEVPMPLKELLFDEEVVTAQSDLEAYDANFWTLPQEDQQMISTDQQMMMDSGDNSLWNFLAGYSVPDGNVNI